MDQYLALALGICGVAIFVSGYFVGVQERRSREHDDTENGVGGLQ